MQKIRKSLLIDIASAGLALSLVAGIGYIAGQKETINRLADANYPPTTDQLLQEAREYLNINDKYSLMYDSLAQAKDFRLITSEQELQILQYRGLISYNNKRTEFINEQQNRSLAILIPTALVLTAGNYLLVAASERWFNRMLS